MLNQKTLAVDKAGTPLGWLDYEAAACAYSKGKIIWEFGKTDVTLRGGTNAKTGSRSLVKVSSIVAMDGPVMGKIERRVPLERHTLLARDRHLCAYCGNVFKEVDLTKDHVTPTSKGGKDVWNNVVCACKSCNNKKDNRTPEEARMPLLFLPYTPNIFENMILSNRTILADQMDYLIARVPKSSRLHLQ